MKHLYSRLFLIILFAAVFAGCSAPGAATNGGDAYSSTIQPIFDAKGSSCPGAGKTDAGVNLTSWDHLIQGSDSGEAIVAFDSEHSVIVRMATQLVGGAHPANQPASALTEAEVVTLKSWIDQGAKGPNGLAPFSGNREFVYVTNQGEATINVIDVEANVVARRVDLTKMGFDKGAKPHHVAVEPDGSFWYATLISGGVILKFNRNNEIVGRSVFEVPGLLSMDPSSNKLYVGRSMAAVNPPQRIGMIDRETMEIEELDVFFPRPHALAVSADGEYVYSASLAENKAIAVEVKNEESTFVDIDGPIHTVVDLEVSPDGKIMIGTAQLTGKLFFFDATNPAEFPLIEAIDVNAAPWHPVFSRDGAKVYFANKMAQTVTVVDVASRKVEAVIEGYGLAQPHGAALSLDGKTLYISGNNLNAAYESRHDFGEGSRSPGTVAVIDLTTNKVVKVLEVGLYASGTAGRPSF